MVSEKPQPNSTWEVKCSDVYPLRIFKQILSMFCSINKENTSMDELKNYILNKDSTDFPCEKYRLGMYLYSGSLIKRAPLSVEFYIGNNGPKFRNISELAIYPLGFIMLVDSDGSIPMPCVDLTTFAQCEYNQKCDITMILPVYECNTMLPADFRSKDEIEELLKEHDKDKP